MIEVSNECVGCDKDMGCIGPACPYLHVVRFFCDRCKDEVDKLYKADGDELCSECLLDDFESIEVSDYELD